eukprot:gb/GEZN01014343.1/.p1 GENE.gb/GEZN01014343.1/~~gb/GEZN01014343.1/.p1  ORF type:complete len:204 (-),score=37.56 gb/GEZN01014343.1/:291-902(-)
MGFLSSDHKSTLIRARLLAFCPAPWTGPFLWPPTHHRHKTLPPPQSQVKWNWTYTESTIKAETVKPLAKYMSSVAEAAAEPNRIPSAKDAEVKDLLQKLARDQGELKTLKGELDIAHRSLHENQIKMSELIKFKEEAQGNLEATESHQQTLERDLEDTKFANAGWVDKTQKGYTDAKSKALREKEKAVAALKLFRSWRKRRQS